MERRNSSEDCLFALDVGTRKVAGLWVERGPEGAKVLAHVVKEHPERAMIDGQVHLIEKAAKVVREVKAELETLIGRRLDAAHVAVAGRALMSSEHTVRLKTGSRAPLSREQVLLMELQAVREAKAQLKDPRAAAGSHCVGYNVSSMSLDGNSLQSLEGHSGEEVELQLLATFLPKLVLESLNGVLQASGLSLASLTLEPIAAVQIAVPSDLRRLNIAMVDIGAGTSDIALTRDGRVAAFAMVPVAGDELSERLADAFLLDFAQAESLKRTDSGGLGAVVTDMFGHKRLVEPREIWREALSSIAYWAGEVGHKILEINGGKAPQAVLLVGGGSQAPHLDVALAEVLGIPTARVGGRPANLQREFVDLPQELHAAWSTTPLGIALSALERRGLPFANFKVNEQWVQVLNLNQSFAAFDALVAAGKDLHEFYARPGLALSYEFNGVNKVERGSMGSPAKLYVNGQAAAVDAHVSPGDSITFVAASAGQDGKLRLYEGVERELTRILSYRFNGEIRSYERPLRVNGKEISSDLWIPDRAKIEVAPELSLEAILINEGFDLSGLISRSIAVRVDGEPKVLTQRNYRLAVNGQERSLESDIEDGDRIEFDPSLSFHERLRDLIATPQDAPRLRIKVNGDWQEVEAGPARLTMNGREVSPDEFLIDGAEILIDRERREVGVIELLAQLPFDSARLRAQAFELKVNGAPSSFNVLLSEGDDVELKFESTKGN